MANLFQRPDLFGNTFSDPNGIWEPDVTAGTVNPDLTPGPQVNFSSPGAFNVNYPTLNAAKAVADLFGGEVRPQNLAGMGPAGAPSKPMYGLDFGIGDPQNAGQIAFWLQRGDKPEDIKARIAAGISPPLGPSNMNQSLQWNAPVYQGAYNAQGGVLGNVKPATHLGSVTTPTGGAQSRFLPYYFPQGSGGSGGSGAGRSGVGAGVAAPYSPSSSSSSSPSSLASYLRSLALSRRRTQNPTNASSNPSSTAARTNLYNFPRA